MAYVDNPNSNQDSGQVAGPNPLGSGSSQMVPEGDQSSQQTQGSTPIQSGSTSDSGASTTNKKAPKASSGMFTNIQKYVEKNKPQAQKISSAVTGDIGKQAESIRNATEQKQQQQQQIIDSNQQAVQQQTTEAQNLVSGIMGDQQQSPETSQIDRFQQLMQGPADTQKVENLNLAQEQAKTGALQKLAQGVNTEQGRRNLLGSTFQKQGDYTRGMSGLDQLITSGDRVARENLIKGTQGTVKDISDRVAQTGQQSRDAAAHYKDSVSDFGQRITDMAANPEQQLQGSIDAAHQQALAERAAIFGEDSPEYQEALASAQARIDQLGTLGGGSLGDFTNYIQKQMKAGTGVGWKGADHANVQNALNNMNEFEQTGKITLPGRTTVDSWGNKSTTPDKVLKGAEARDYMKNSSMMDLSHHKEREQVRELTNRLNKNIIGEDTESLYGLDSLGKNKGDLNLYNMYENLKNQYKGLGSAEDIVNRNVSKMAGGQSFEDIQSGADIQRLDTADQAQIDKINALKSLLGQEDILSKEQVGDQAYTSSEDIQNLLRKFGN